MRHTLLADHLADHASRGARPAVVWRRHYRTERWSYRDLSQAIDVGAARLMECGISRGDRVLLRGPDSPALTAALLSCVRIGAIAVPLDPGASCSMVSTVASQADIRAAVLVSSDPWESPQPRLDLAEIRPGRPVTGLPPPHRAGPDEILEIIFTSGSTGEPRGVTITHGNVLAYVDRIEAGYRKRRLYVDPFLPLPLLCLPPLSHMFGQAVGIFLPLRLGCTVVHVESRDPATLLQVMRKEGITLTMTVPRILEMLTRQVREQASRQGWPLDALVESGDRRGVMHRAWAARRVQRWLGWRMRGFVVGGAPLGADMERFWRGLGYILVQGYGLTETAPVVTLTHPFRGTPGTVGKPLKGQEVRLAADGEILVRGANVMAGYWNDETATREALDADGWLHTGDVGTQEDDGLRIIGRKKEMIVTADGMNVHPEDVERRLRGAPGVRDAVVHGIAGQCGEEVHAALLLSPGGSPEVAISTANGALEPHERVRSFTTWEGADFPRTPTGKVRRRDVAAAVQARSRTNAASPSKDPADDLASILARVGVDPDRIVGPATLEALGLSSLDLVEISAALEERYGMPVEDGALEGSTSVAMLRSIVSGDTGVRNTAAATPVAGMRADSVTLSSGLRIPFPRWPRSRPARLARWLLRDGLIVPGIAAFTPLDVRGREHLQALAPPALIVANHVSLFDVPVLLRVLPWKLRRHTSPAMTAEYYRPWLAADGSRSLGLARHLQFLLASLLFEIFLLPRRQGFRDSLRHAGEIADAGGCPILFPEGLRSVDGMARFQAGVGLMATRLDLPVVPIHLAGLETVLPPAARWPRRSPVRVTVGEVLRFEPDEDPALAASQVEQAVRQLLPPPTVRR